MPKGGNGKGPKGPKIEDQTFAASENPTDGTVVGTVVSDINPRKATWSILSGNDDGAFAIDPLTGELRVVDGSAIDYENEQTRNLVVQVENNGKNAYSATVTVDVTDVNEDPVAGGALAETVAEDVSEGTVLATASATDPDTLADSDADGANDTFNDLTYAITSGDPGTLFVIDEVTGEVRLAAGKSLDYETAQQHVLEVTVTDGGGLSDTQSITIDVTDVNEDPVAGGALAETVAEDVSEGTLLATASATDPDTLADSDADGANDTFNDLTYAITSGDPGSLFGIHAVTGEVSLAAGKSLDYETAQQHVLEVTVTDGGGLSDTQSITIDVTDVNEDPVAGGALAETVAEDVSEGTVLATASATDPDTLADSDADGANDTFNDLTYAITSGDPGSLFGIHAVTGEVSLAAGKSLDYETAQQHVLEVTVTDGGGLSDTQSITIDVTDVNEDPVAGGALAETVAEDVSEGTVLATASATDPDTLADSDADGANDTFNDLTYAITSGDPGSLFGIHAVTGEVSLAAGKSLDYETAQQHVLEVTVTDGGGLSDTQSITIDVTDVNEDPVAGGALAETVAEDVSEGTVLATASATDPDTLADSDADGANDTFNDLTYAITSGDPDTLFVIDEVTGEVRLAAGKSLDYETAQQHVLEVTVTDGGGLSDTQSVTVNVTDVNEASFDLASLNGANGFRLFGPATDTGRSVASAGDVNGDGFDDVIIGATHGNPAGRTSAGESYVVFGKASGFAASLDLATLDGSNGFSLAGIDPDDNSGFSVASAGDVNGDGFDDIIIGAHFADPGGDAAAGESYVVFGKASGFAASLDLASLDGTNGFRLDGIDPSDISGWSVASAGDVNGDGFDDIIIGAEGGDPGGRGDAGESYVVFGKASGFAASLDLATLDGSNGFILEGIGTSDFSGRSLASAGDVNGDGFDDIIIGAHRADPGGGQSGESYVVFGKASGFASSFNLANLDGSNGFRLDGIDFNDQSGKSVASAGDINADGYDDIIIGAEGGDPGGDGQAGESYVVFGKASGFAASLDLASLDGTNGFRLDGIDPGDQSGRSVASAGDVNGDGFDDIIIGALYADPYGHPSAGESYVIYGKASGFDASIDLASLDGINGFVLNGISTNDNSGGSVASAGDVNGDGFDDIIIGANNGGSGGESYVVFGGAFGKGNVAVSTIGTAAAEILIGGLGDDTLAGGGGADVIRAGTGDDILGISDTTFARIDGGLGIDTLRLDGAGINLDLTQVLPSIITDIEQIDLTGTGANSLTLNQLDVFDLTGERDGGKAIISVTGDADDTVTLADDGWGHVGIINDGDTIFNRYMNGNAEVRIEQGVDSFTAYQMMPGTFTYFDALNLADDQIIGGVSGHLLAIEGAGENQFVYEWLLNFSDLATIGNGVTWLSISDAAAEGVWRYTSGPDDGELAYTNWGGIDPTSGPGEDYGLIAMDLVGGYIDAVNEYGIALPYYIVEYNDIGSDPGLIDNSFIVNNVTGEFTYVGDATANNIVASDGNDTIYGKGGNDTLTGGPGDDLFVFGNGSGNDDIVGFVAGAASEDVIDIAAFGFGTFSAVQAATNDDLLGNTVITLDDTLGADDSITLLGVEKADLHEDDFQLT